MIKITKDLHQIPQSLIPAYSELFPGLPVVPQKSRTTHEKRMLIISKGAYIESKDFSKRYKINDIRDSLSSIYKGKCAFCEQKIEQYHVEHYRPKSIYYWLAFSWDNLLLSCPTCNQFKDTHFDIDGVVALFDRTDQNIKIINNSSASYDLIERPRMVNPEVTDSTGMLRFQKNGKIESDNPRFVYTIEKCHIDRKSLNDRRRSILDRLKEHLRDIAIQHNNSHDKKIALTTLIQTFIIDSKNSENEFLAFRRFAISSDWLNEFTKEVF